MPLQQSTCENNVAKVEIVHNDLFLLLPLCFQLCSIIILSYIENFHIFDLMFSKSCAADLFYFGKEWAKAGDSKN